MEDLRVFGPCNHGPRRHQGRQVTGGESLSLASIYRLVQRSGGDLSLDIERGKSATFTVFLPRASSGDELPAALRGPTEARATSPS